MKRNQKRKIPQTRYQRDEPCASAYIRVELKTKL